MGLGRFDGGGGGGLAQNTFKEFFKSFLRGKVFLENIYFLRIRSLFVRHVTCHAQLLTFVSVQIYGMLEEYFFI